MSDHSISTQPRARAGRCRSAALALACALVPTVFGAVALADGPKTDGDPGLDFKGFMHLTDLGYCTGQDPHCVPSATSKHPAQLRMIGEDGAGNVAFYDVGVPHGIFSVDAEGHQTSVVEEPAAVPADAGVPTTYAVDTNQHRIFLGTATSQRASSDLCGPPFTIDCTTGPLAQTPVVAAVQLPGGDSVTYKFSSAYAGQDVVALTPVDTESGRHLLYALLYLDTGGATVVGDPGATGHSLQLVSLDVDKLTAKDPNAAVLWSYSIPECASMPNWSTNLAGDYLGIDPSGRTAYFACRGSASKSAPGSQVPAGAVTIDFGATTPTDSAAPTHFATSYYPQGAGASFSISGGDQQRGLLFLTSVASVNKQYVFNEEHRAWTGSVPFRTGGNGNLWGSATDVSTGRDYVVYAQDFAVAVQDDQLPVPQGAELSLGDLVPVNAQPPVIERTTHTLFIDGSFSHTDGTAYPSSDVIAIYQDTREVPPVPKTDDPDALTHEVAITPDTPVTFGSFASAYGSKLTLVGGLHSTPLGNAATIGPGLALSEVCAFVPDPRFCFGAPTTSDGSRTVTFGQVARTEMSNSAAKGDATSMAEDDGTAADGRALSTYNPAVEVWHHFAAGEPPAIPTAGSVAGDPSQQVSPATCSDLGGGARAQSTNGAKASCNATDQVASAAAAYPDQQTNLPLKVGYSASSTRVTHTTDNEATTQAVAVARGIRIEIPNGPTVAIGEVAAAATSTAAGLKDTAKSVFSRGISEVTVTDPSGAVIYACGFAKPAEARQPCDPRQLTDAVSAQSPSPVVFLTPDPDGTQGVVGSPGGAQAEVIKSPYEYWNDYFTNADDGYEVPGLQIIMVGDQSQPSRLVLNLAGVHVESHDAIGLPPPPPPVLPAPTLSLALTDGSTPALPLSGGSFTLQGPDGVAPQTCTTAADGVGDCTFSNLQPGDYTIHEAAAPPGYATAADYPLSLEAGQAYSLTFVNLPAIGSVHISLASAGDTPEPLANGVFAMFTGSSVLDAPVATCTTDANGECGFDNVPLGDYTMHQVTAPDGFLTSEDVPFSLSEPGQRASLNFVDSTPGVPAVPPVPPTFIPGKPAIPPHTEVIHIPGKHVPPVAQPDLQPVAYQTSVVPPPVVHTASTAGTPPIVLGGGHSPVSAVTRVPAQLARLFAHSPQQAVLLLFIWIVLGLPVYLFIRRRQFIVATERA